MDNKQTEPKTVNVNINFNFDFEFVKNNFLYLIWFIIYFTITYDIVKARFANKYNIFSFIVTLIIYIISIGIALSPIGEKILRFINGVRQPATKQEKEYLIPIFDDVYTEAKKACPKLAQNIEICIMDAMYINAFALGRKTVAVTTGAIQTLSEEELKGFISHELGHIANGDTKAKLITTIGNGFFSIFAIILEKILNIVDIYIDRRNFLWLTIKTITYVILLYLVYLAQITLSINSRKNEYRADEFAYDIGYGNNLKDSLYLLQRMCISDKSSLVNKLRASHPNIAKRIGRLEDMIDCE